MAAHLHRDLAKKLDYHGEIDSYNETALAKDIQKQQLVRLRQSRNRAYSSGYAPATNSASERRYKSKSNYNKWYINPELHFKMQQENPKNDKKLLHSEDFVYKNLRNEEFWNWVHPFEAGKMPKVKTNSALEKLDPKIFEGFKKYIQESSAQKRLPSIVEHILQINSRRQRKNSQEKQ